METHFAYQNVAQTDGAFAAIGTCSGLIFGQASQLSLSLLVEVIGLLLPGSVTFYANLDASKYHLLTTTKVDSQLHDISILDWVEP